MFEAIFRTAKAPLWQGHDPQRATKHPCKLLAHSFQEKFSLQLITARQAVNFPNKALEPRQTHFGNFGNLAIT
eukprot:1020579-Pelagomonas_calceolata.AAC.1